MTLKRLVSIIPCVILTACAASLPQQPSHQIVALQQYSATQFPLAQQGKIKWSDYYSGLRDRQIDAGAPYEIVHLVSQLVYGAQAYEKGEISEEEFQRRRSYAKTMMQDISLRMSQDAQARQDANRALALQYLATHPINVPQAQYVPVLPIQPHSAPALQLPQIQPAPAGVTASWTGQQRQVQTITNQFGWSCEYRYTAQTFWRTFVGACPSTVQVQ